MVGGGYAAKVGDVDCARGHAVEVGRRHGDGLCGKGSRALGREGEKVLVDLIVNARFRNRTERRSKRKLLSVEGT
jgi:hypothetical protein